jgi:Zn-dependent peptidase ImmA (M78 family)
MSSIPKKIKIGYQTYDVLLVPELNNDRGHSLFGQHSFKDHSIKIWNQCSPVQRKATLVHELLHSLFDMYYPLNSQDEEPIVEALSNGLVTALQDNKNLRNYLCDNV